MCDCASIAVSVSSYKRRPWLLRRQDLKLHSFRVGQANGIAGLLFSELTASGTSSARQYCGTRRLKSRPSTFADRREQLWTNERRSETSTRQPRRIAPGERIPLNRYATFQGWAVEKITALTRSLPSSQLHHADAPVALAGRQQWPGENRIQGRRASERSASRLRWRGTE